MSVYIPEIIHPDMASGFNRLSDTLTAAARRQDEREADAAKNLILKRQSDVEERRLAMEERRAKSSEANEETQRRRELAAEHEKIAILHAKDPHLAASYVNSIYGPGSASVEPVYDQQQAAPPQAVFPPPPPTAGGMPPAASQEPQGRPQSQLGQLTQAAVSPPNLEQSAQPPAQDAQHMDVAHAILTGDQRAANNGQSVHQFTEARDALKQQGQLAGYRLRYKLGGHGSQNEDVPETVIDPLEQRAIAKRQSDAHAQELVAQLQQTNLPPQYHGQMVAMLSQQVPPDKAWNEIRLVMAHDADVAQRRDAATGRGDAARDVATTRSNALIDAAKLRRGKAGAGAGGAAGFDRKTEDQNLKELASIEAAQGKFVKESGIDKEKKTYQDLRTASQELQGAKNPQTQLAILDKYIRSATGLGVRQKTLEMYLSHMGGTDAQISGWIEGKSTGNLGAQQIATLTDAVHRARASTLDSLNAHHDAYVKSHFTGAEANVKGNWELKHQELFGDILDDKGRQIFATEHDPNAATVVRASGRRSTATRGVNAPSGNPLVNAAKASAPKPPQQGPQLNEADKAKLRDALHRNPSDPRADRIRKLLGE